ncbi:MAG TPA: hypothetical protein PKD41_12070, partial [Solidesulfovibrio sp.]|nr:hypothetical protein [Desulfovibrio sp.]HML61624.1 hypothetical protein [Solidesulfovibrio sp.]
MNVSRPAAVLALTLGLCLTLAAPGEAFRRKSTVTGPGGRSATNEATTVRTPGGYSRSATTTGPNNNAVTRNSAGQYNPATRTWSSGSTATGPG